MFETDVLVERPECHHINLPTWNTAADTLIMPVWNVRRYRRPPHDTIFPLEYAFHLMGDVREKTIVDLGCGNGLNTVILAALGARVVSIDVTEQNLDTTVRRASVNGLANQVGLLRWERSSIALADGTVDCVLVTGLRRDTDAITTARQIRRILKPGGMAVFQTSLPLPFLLDAIRASHHNHEHDGLQSHPVSLRIDEVDVLSRAIGIRGRRRAFWLFTRLLLGSGIPSASPLARLSQRFDAILLNRFPSIRQLASVLVWEARKEW